MSPTTDQRRFLPDDSGIELPRRVRSAFAEDVKEVGMSFCDVTRAEDTRPRIGTTSLASCAGIAIYDPVAKVGGVAHAFFNDKESMTVYARDTSGREIPSSGRSIIVNNPAPFAPFEWLSDSLIKKADALGGQQYIYYTFNIEHGCRTPEQNQQLEAVVQSVISQLTTAGKIISTESRHETGFILDTRDGSFMPVWF